MEGEERQAIESGRSLESKSCSLGSSQSARRVNILSSISSFSSSDFPDRTDDKEAEEEDDSTMIFVGFLGLNSEERIESRKIKIRFRSLNGCVKKNTQTSNLQNKNHRASSQLIRPLQI